MSSAQDLEVANLIQHFILNAHPGNYILPGAVPGWIFTAYGAPHAWYGATPVAFRLPAPLRSGTLTAS